MGCRVLAGVAGHLTWRPCRRVCPPVPASQAILVHPALLSYRVQERLQPFFEYLTGELGLSPQEAASVVQRRPSIVGVEVDGLRRMVAFLLESGNTKEQVVELMATSL